MIGAPLIPHIMTLGTHNPYMQAKPGSSVPVNIQAMSYLGTSVTEANISISWSTTLASGTLVSLLEFEDVWGSVSFIQRFILET